MHDTAHLDHHWAYHHWPHPAHDQQSGHVPHEVVRPSQGTMARTHHGGPVLQQPSVAAHPSLHGGQGAHPVPSGIPTAMYPWLPEPTAPIGEHVIGPDPVSHHDQRPPDPGHS